MLDFVIEQGFAESVPYPDESFDFASLILLDALPWDETIEAAPRLQPKKARSCIRSCCCAT